MYINQNCILTNKLLKTSVFIYTSDHGQNFHDEGAEGYSTHCNRPADNSEGRVPMMVITGHDRWQDKFRQAASDRQGSADHFQVYPTILQLLGYNQQSVSYHYNSDLLKGEKSPSKFLQLFWTRFGTQPEWVNISKKTPLSSGHKIGVYNLTSAISVDSTLSILIENRK